MQNIHNTSVIKEFLRIKCPEKQKAVVGKCMHFITSAKVSLSNLNCSDSYTLLLTKRLTELSLKIKPQLYTEIVERHSSTVSNGDDPKFL